MTALTEIISTTSTVTEATLSLGGFTLCILVALALGLILSAATQYKSNASKSFAMTIALLPAVVGVVIMMVNGSIGAGIAVAGTFSLVRFRSVPGTAKEIVAVFIAMAIGLACGMGNIDYAIVFTAITVIALVAMESIGYGDKKGTSKDRTIRITIPEDLDYTEIFADLFDQYTSHHELASVKTTNLGSMFRLTYNVTLNDPYEEKEFIDSLRVRNGNLEISSSLLAAAVSEL